MEHDRFYNTFREKLENRTIVPSTEAWNILEAQLENRNALQKNRKIYYWIAASVIALCISSISFLSVRNNNTSLPLVQQETNNSFPEETDPVVKKMLPVVKENTEESSHLKKDTKPVTQETVADRQQLRDVQTEKRSPETQKIEEVVAEIQKLQETKEVTEAEVDALLIQAQKELMIKRAPATDSIGSINAMALLENVEEEIDQSFKEKVFETLKENFYKVKTAVAERNN